MRCGPVEEGNDVMSVEHIVTWTVLLIAVGIFGATVHGIYLPKGPKQGEHK